MKKFIVSVFLLGWLPLYAAGSSLQETEEVAVANEMSEAGSVDTDRFNVPLQKEKKRQSPREKQKRVMNTEKTVSQIALDNGFASSRAFSREFQKKYNRLPSEVRQKFNTTPKE